MQRNGPNGIGCFLKIKESMQEEAKRFEKDSDHPEYFMHNSLGSPLWLVDASSSFLTCTNTGGGVLNTQLFPLRLGRRLR
ncbi:hypothetical protein NQ318_012876 [Aromia moschata]|uniref:Uncharacterized protein n=1 Tax=Aromia moschata TaxID=1265417 RepID=A0AAV8YC57_9CUCU|nr:hypothetical protein NQ318_012876 [Aromia moschata]